MKYVLFLALVIPTLSKAQENVTGLGTYRIGTTTPDSLNRTEFKEEDPSYVKGTIALPCAHIRTFTAATAKIAGIPVDNVVLTFYDDRLFKIVCDYSDSLKVAFLKQYGHGVRRPASRFRLCTKEADKLMSMWAEVWPDDAVLALVVHMNGYTAECKREEGARLILASQRLSALSSDCDLKPADPLVEEYIRSR